MTAYQKLKLVASFDNVVESRVTVFCAMRVLINYAGGMNCLKYHLLICIRIFFLLALTTHLRVLASSFVRF
jgi:hypothetical protein